MTDSRSKAIEIIKLVVKCHGLADHEDGVGMWVIHGLWAGAMRAVLGLADMHFPLS